MTPIPGGEGSTVQEKSGTRIHFLTIGFKNRTNAVHPMPRIGIAAK